MEKLITTFHHDNRVDTSNIQFPTIPVSVRRWVVLAGINGLQASAVGVPRGWNKLKRAPQPPQRPVCSRSWPARSTLQSSFARIPACRHGTRQLNSSSILDCACHPSSPPHLRAGQARPDHDDEGPVLERQRVGVRGFGAPGPDHGPW